MRILAISASTRLHLLGGMEDHLHTLMSGLAARGHEITVLTARHPDGIAEEVSDGVRWVYVDSGAHWLDSSWPAASVAAARKLLAETPFDVIHSQASGGLAVVKAGIAGLPPVVLSLHGQYLSIVRASFFTVAGHPTPTTIARTALDLPGIVATNFRQGNWRGFRGCEATVPSNAERTASRLAFMLERDHVHVVRNGVDTDLFRPGDRAEARATMDLPSDVPIALGVGRLDRGKGMQYAIEALGQLTTPADSELLLVGDGGKRADFERLAQALGVGHLVRFLGRRSPEDVAVLMRCSDVVLFPTLLGEAGPLVVAQAMASAKPVIASNRGAVPEMLGRDGRAGLLVPAGRSKPIARALERLLGDPALRAQMGERGRAVAVREMSIGRMIDETYAVYVTAIRRHR
jgi:glycosyltransferase involved in cell wall biosynthesis